MKYCHFVKSRILKEVMKSVDDVFVETETEDVQINKSSVHKSLSVSF